MLPAGNILALDTATTTGWACGLPGETPAFGSITLSTYSNGQCLFEFREWLAREISMKNPGLVVFESTMTFSKTNAKVAARLQGLARIVEEYCYRSGVKCKEANPATVKLFWSGNGRAKKPQMVDVARAHGYKPRDDNEADALAIWHYTVDCYAQKAVRDAFRQRQFEIGMGVGSIPIFPA